MRVTLVLAMHGAPPSDFPPLESGEYFRLRQQLERKGGPELAPAEARYRELEGKMRDWPRSTENDPFCLASHELGHALAGATGREVFVGFNEFCGPSLDQALDRAARHAQRVIVMTPMMTRGGEHAEIEIPEAIGRAQERHPDVDFT
jgi:sirohydrochlorin cobaltochelatase